MWKRGEKRGERKNRKKGAGRTSCMNNLKFSPQITEDQTELLIQGNLVPRGRWPSGRNYAEIWSWEGMVLLPVHGNHLLWGRDPVVAWSVRSVYVQFHEEFVQLEPTKLHTQRYERNQLPFYKPNTRKRSPQKPRKQQFWTSSVACSWAAVNLLHYTITFSQTDMNIPDQMI